MTKTLPILFSLFLASTTSIAQDRLFAYTYQTNVLNKGDFDLEFQNTLLTGKKGKYSPYVFGQSLKQRLEFEVGLGRNVQTAFYFNSEVSHSADTTSTAINQELKVSFSNEWKWKLSDPVANKIGFGLYGEVEFGGSNVEFEGKLLFDKQLPKDLFAFNIAGKYEIEKEVSRTNNVTKAVWTHNSPIELYFGYLHHVSKEISFGMEARNNNAITKEDGWINSIVFAGPAFHATIGKCFVNVTAFPQLTNLRKTAAAPGNRDYDNFEKLEVRIHLGYDF
ncbi:MAG: hypothetical protein M3Y85_06000 [Bacteroidota bacterium]|nr:hypothetical protein [Bacteroidota bacterium]